MTVDEPPVHIIAGWRLSRLYADMGYGQVWEAVDASQRTACVTLYHPGCADGPPWNWSEPRLSELTRERLFVRAFSEGKVGDRRYQITERWRMLPRDRRQEPSQVLAWLRTLVAGLFAAERHDRFFRLLDWSDLGLADDDGGERLVMTDERNLWTEQAPEMPSRSAAAASSDLVANRPAGAARHGWLLGPLTYAFLTASWWFQDMPPHTFMEMLGHKPRESAVARARALSIELPSAFDAWMARCMRARPEERFGSASEALAAIERILA